MNELAIQPKPLDDVDVTRHAGESRQNARLKEACREFEGMLLSIILKEGMRPAWRDDDEQMTGAENLNEFAIEQTARALGQQGAFGIAEMMMAQLDR